MLSYFSSASNWVRTQAFGREPSRGSILLALLVAGATIALGGAMLLGAGLQLAWWQWALVVVVAFDIGGGVIANATPAAARQYHRLDRPWEPVLFAAGHVHPFVIAWLLPGYNWQAGATLYIATIVAVIAT